MAQLVKSLLCKPGDLSRHTCHLGVPQWRQEDPWILLVSLSSQIWVPLVC